MSPKFTYVTPAVRELLHSLFASEVAYLVRVECLQMIKLVMAVFCSIES